MHHQRTRPAPDAEPFLLPNQVADLLHVTPKTVTRRAKDGRLPHRRTLGHRRYPEAAIRELLASLTEEVRAA
jgi:predicted DNA-binding transcriptional regulator AlpA